MNGRRRFLSLLLTLPLWPSRLLAGAEDEFERYKRQQSEGFQSLQAEWGRYQATYLAAWNDYRNRLGKVWSKPELSAKKVWVEYSDNLKVRRTLDFEHNEVRISFTADEAARITDERIRAEFERIMSASVQQAWQQDPVLSRSEKNRPSDSKTPVSGLMPADWQQQFLQKKSSRQQTGKGEVITITIPLPANAVPERSREYLPLVQQFAGKWKVDPALVLAIMETESAFNPMARSQIPAFGLMQIVPTSAGRDASKLVYGSERLMTGAQLCTPATNIEMGCAYLSLLDSRYLSAITDPQSRRFCVIAAYNTGAGNVARAFSGNTSVADAAKRINRMTPKQVYTHLRSQLKYEEARNYVQKVTTALTQYQS
ncbi:transglycosylase SLT domain-containing protein [Thalassolituus sp. LLYu03]|uniref:transglycosylase SLT domain-containing protein n=1 Tax=Thalassolituus sp. LLYu03 TaxID=3421656 RepID=UPI003D2A9FC2